MKTIKISLYNTEIKYFFEPNFKKGAKIIKKFTGMDASPGGTNATFWSKPDYVGIIWFEVKANASTISHEAIHAAWFILDECGIKVDSNNHEALTYLSSYIIKNIKL